METEPKEVSKLAPDWAQGLYVWIAVLCVAIGLGVGIGAWAGWIFMGVLTFFMITVHVNKHKKPS